MDDVVDGNAAAGALGEIFFAEVTVAVTTCASCGDARPVGELRVHLDAPGVVLRCTSCNAAQIKVVRSPRRAWLDVRGVSVFEFPLPGDD